MTLQCRENCVVVDNGFHLTALEKVGSCPGEDVIIARNGRKLQPLCLWQ